MFMLTLFTLFLPTGRELSMSELLSQQLDNRPAREAAKAVAGEATSGGGGKFGMAAEMAGTAGMDPPSPRGGGLEDGGETLASALMDLR